MRNKRTSDYVRIQPYIPQALYAQVLLHLPHDPFLSRPKHGAISELVAQLLDEWVTKQAQSAKDGA